MGGGERGADGRARRPGATFSSLFFGIGLGPLGETCCTKAPIFFYLLLVLAAALARSFARSERLAPRPTRRAGHIRVGRTVGTSFRRRGIFGLDSIEFSDLMSDPRREGSGRTSSGGGKKRRENGGIGQKNVKQIDNSGNGKPWEEEGEARFEDGTPILHEWPGYGARCGQAW